MDAAQRRTRLAETHEAVARHFSSMSLDDAYLEGPAGSWRPIDDLRHLTLSNVALEKGFSMPGEGIDARFGTPERPSLPWDECASKVEAALAHGRPSLERFVPSPEPVGDRGADRERHLAEWREVAERLDRAIDDWPDEELDRHQLPHPYLGMLTLGDWLCFSHVHDRHHIRVSAQRIAKYRQPATKETGGIDVN